MYFWLSILQSSVPVIYSMRICWLNDVKGRILMTFLGWYNAMFAYQRFRKKEHKKIVKSMNRITLHASLPSKSYYIDDLVKDNNNSYKLLRFVVQKVIKI